MMTAIVSINRICLHCGRQRGETLLSTFQLNTSLTWIIWDYLFGDRKGTRRV